MESRTKLEQEMRKVFKEVGVRQSDSLWPILIQMPVSWPCSKLYQELTFERQVISYGLTWWCGYNPVFRF